MTNFQQSKRIKITGLLLGLIAISFYVGFFIVMMAR